MRIADYLLVGEEHPTRGSDLVAMTGLPLRRVVALIEQERRAGVPICASSRGVDAGYFIAPDRATVYRYCDSLRHRERELAQTRKACIAAAEKLPKGE